LSTSTLGNAEVVVRSLFAPACVDGFGVSYTPVLEGIEFMVTWGDEAGQAEIFLSKLEPAAELLYNFTAAI
ncbi:MAG TPA: choline/carnitine O-acyltransferase, partial [Enteractinococcus helveticum]